MKNDWKNIFFTFFTLLCFGFGWGQSFSLSGSVIIQSGTGTDYSGLETISGVSLTTIGAGTSEEVKFYNLGNYQLRIQGSLTINPRKEVLFFGNGLASNTAQILVRGTGTFTIIDEENYGTGENTKTFYSKNTPFFFSRLGGQAWVANNMHIQVENGGRLNMYGISLDLTGDRGIYYTAGSHGIIRDVTLRGGHSGSPRIYLLGAQDVDGLDVYDFNAINLDDNLIQFKNVTPHNVAYSLFFNGGSDENRIIEVEDFNLYTGNDVNEVYYTLVGQGSIKWELKNKVSGTDGFISLLRSNTSKYVVEILQDIDFNITDLENNLTDLVVYASDINNGSRKNYTAGNANTNTNYTNSRTYEQRTSNGKAEFRDILTAAVVVNSSSDSGNVEQSNPVPAQIDYRTKTTDGTDVLDFHIYSYGYLPAVVSPKLKGAGVKEVDRVLFVDSAISQIDKSIVDTYTEIETLDKLYDRSSSWKVDNVADEFPTVDTFLATANGKELDLGSQNLVVDANASQAFVVDTSTNTITLKANSLTVGNGNFTSITTTGSISVQNGGEILFGYEDGNGKNIFVDFNWGTSDTYHVNIVDLNDDTVIATHNNQSNNYSGIFVAPSPFGSGVKIQLLNTGDNSVFYEANLINENALSFVRTSGSIDDISTETTGVAQHEALFLARKILQKTESMASALDGTTPTLADDTTTITEASSTIATKENQEAIRALLLRILTKTSASYEALKGAE